MNNLKKYIVDCELDGRVHLQQEESANGCWMRAMDVEPEIDRLNGEIVNLQSKYFKASNSAYNERMENNKLKALVATHTADKDVVNAARELLHKWQTNPRSVGDADWIDLHTALKAKK